MFNKLELNIMKTIAKREYTTEAREKLNKIADEEFQQIKQNTIDYCENELNEVFEIIAQTKGDLIVKVEFALEKDRTGNTIACPLKLGDCKYANGRLSYIPDRKQMFDLKIMESHLKKYCFSITYEEGIYYSYGIGRQKSTIMVISAEE